MKLRRKKTDFYLERLLLNVKDLDLVTDKFGEANKKHYNKFWEEISNDFLEEIETNILGLDEAEGRKYLIGIKRELEEYYNNRLAKKYGLHQGDSNWGEDYRLGVADEFFRGVKNEITNGIENFRKTFKSKSVADSKTRNQEEKSILPDKLIKKDPEETIKRLDRFQTALLFHYLMKHGAALKHSNPDYSKIVHFLTGHSAQNMQRLGLTGLENVKKDRVADEGDDHYVNKSNLAREQKAKGKVKVNYNLNQVKKLLQDILKEVNDDIKKHS